MPLAPEQQAREKIDEALAAAGLGRSDDGRLNVLSARGVATCECPLASSFGHADYARFVDGKPPESSGK